MSETRITHWQPRVIRHTYSDGRTEYAIHDVYFGENDQVVTYTEDALSPREDSIAALERALSRLWELSAQEPVQSGDLQYDYEREDIQEWLQAISLDPVDYNPVASDEL
jgi:hypothetical protein